MLGKHIWVYGNLNDLFPKQNSLTNVCRTVPKSPRKTTELKGRRVFGVPLLLVVQQTGEPLPPSILKALVYLRTQCLDQVRSPRVPGGIQLEPVFVVLRKKRFLFFLFILHLLPGRSFPEIRSKVSHSGPPWAGGVRPRRRLVRRSVRLRRGRHGEAVLQRFTWTHLHEQTLRVLPAHLPMWVIAK